jgi:uncharacterized protein (TIGR03382 family)
MKATIRYGILALLLAVPAVAAAASSRWEDDERVDIGERMSDGNSYSCSAGSGASFLAAGAVVGVLLRRRR